MTLDELDRLSAEKVMDNYGLLLRSDKIWQPTRNIAHAWECLEKVGRPYRIFGQWQDGKFQCAITDGTHADYITDELAPTAPEAIVKACLKARGVKL